MKILALEVALDQRHFTTSRSEASRSITGTVAVPSFLEARQRRSPAISSNFRVHRPHDQRLDDAVLPDRLHELVQRALDEVGAG